MITYEIETRNDRYYVWRTVGSRREGRCALGGVKRRPRGYRRREDAEQRVVRERELDDRARRRLGIE